MTKPDIGVAIVEGLLAQEVGDLIADVKKEFDTKDDFEVFTEVVKESIDEFLMDIYASTEERVTIEDLFRKFKEIFDRRIDEE